MALSTSMPVSRPSGPFRIAPPAGAAVASVIPAALSAAVLATIACPSARVSSTGRSPETPSMSPRSRNRPSGQPVSIQPRPNTGPVPGCAAR
jgi:hypothetical protein